MLKTLRGRIAVILAALAISFGYLYTNGIKLGLDLQGGIHLAMEVNDPDGTLTPEARADAIDRAERIIRTRIDELGVEALERSGGLLHRLSESGIRRRRQSNPDQGSHRPGP